MKFYMKYYFNLIILLIIVSCNQKGSIEKEIEKISVEMEIIRFDTIFGHAEAGDLPELKRSYPYLFPEQYHDSIWILKMKDTLQQQLNDEVLKAFPNNNELEDQLYPLFQHIRYYFPAFEPPVILTLTSEVDYRNKVLLNDDLLLISLDTYLGKDHRFYTGIANYIAKNMEQSQIRHDVASLYAERYIAKSVDRTFLATMIHYGKQLYLKDLWLPSSSDDQKLGYTIEEFNWILENEMEIWRYFIENELLYSTDPKLLNRFIYPAPFSKFYLEIDNDSPGSIGKYIGWQIVRSYMERNAVSIQQLMMMEANEIFKKSKYKPKK
jgi:gliding motility-associated lipoprotein GldB